MSEKTGVNFNGTQDKSQDNFDLDAVDFDAVAERNAERINAQVAPSAESDCEGCKI